MWGDKCRALRVGGSGSSPGSAIPGQQAVPSQASPGYNEGVGLDGWSSTAGGHKNSPGSLLSVYIPRLSPESDNLKFCVGPGDLHNSHTPGAFCCRWFSDYSLSKSGPGELRGFLSETKLLVET